MRDIQEVHGLLIVVAVAVGGVVLVIFVVDAEFMSCEKQISVNVCFQRLDIKRNTDTSSVYKRHLLVVLYVSIFCCLCLAAAVLLILSSLFLLVVNLVIIVIVLVLVIVSVLVLVIVLVLVLVRVIVTVIVIVIVIILVIVLLLLALSVQGFSQEVDSTRS